ncbi:MAG: 2-dehydropantoate 2-reductase [Lentisphaerae bacterium]|nr:2-dehydropantoate 2-reductase [Lentisphaerota bacterium]
MKDGRQGGAAVPQRVVIVGPGAIGCRLAAHLSAAGRDVCLLDRDEGRAAVLRRDGVVSGEGAGQARGFPRIEVDPRAAGPAGCVVVCVKAYDTPAAAPGAVAACAPGGVIVSLQNGAGNAEALAGAAGAADRIVCAVTGAGALLTAPGRVTPFAPFRIEAAPLVPGSDAAVRASVMLECAGVDFAVSPDAATLLWGKLVVSAAINALTAIERIRNGELLSRPEARAAAFAAAWEAGAVARAAGVRLPYGDEAAEVERVCAATVGNRSSMLCDVEAGRRTEIGEINGFVVREGRRLGVAVPANEMLLREIGRLVEARP